MWSPKARRTRTLLVVLVVTGSLVLGGILGGAIVGVGLFTVGGGTASAPIASTEEARTSVQMYDNAGAPTGDLASGAESKAADAASKPISGGSVEPMLVKSANLDLRVEKVSEAIDSIRSIVRRHGAQISDYSVSRGDGGMPVEPYSQSVAPSNAYVTIRVPAKDLDALRADLARIGDVLTESSSASDVTQQYVDMDARLKNLKAEEARLRDFLTKTDKVSELLQVESELSRVRGEIESMQAQLDYLSKQVELSTLTVNLSEPGSVVRPQGIDWGFREALTRGVQGAAGVVTFLITATIALLPLAVVALVVFFAIRALVRRSRRNRPGSPAESDAEIAKDTE